MSEVREDSFCVIIPAYQEATRIGSVLDSLRAVASDVVVIDDGSRDETSRVAREHGAHVIRHDVNLGKGASLVEGFRFACEKGFALVITLDVDGQHDPAEVALFLDAYRRTRIPVLIGNRMWNTEHMPVVRRWTNRFMSWLLSRMMKTYLPDTQCGFRLFRSDLLPYLPTSSSKYAMESEILLQAALRGFRMDSVRISILYNNWVAD